MPGILYLVITDVIIESMRMLKAASTGRFDCAFTPNVNAHKTKVKRLISGIKAKNYFPLTTLPEPDVEEFTVVAAPM